MIEEAATHLASKQLEVFGAFSLVIILGGLIVWWLLRHQERQRLAFVRIIDQKDEKLEKLEALAFQEIRDNASSKAEMLRQLTEAIAVVERLAGQRSAG